MVDSLTTSEKKLTYIWGVMLPISVAAIMCIFTAAHDLRFTFGGIACAMIVLAVALNRARKSPVIQILLWITATAAVATALTVGPHLHS